MRDAWKRRREFDIGAGKNHPWIGKHHTEESKAKMRGHVISDETRKKQSEAAKVRETRKREERANHAV